MFIVEASSSHKNRKERGAKFKESFHRVSENFSAVTSRSEKVKLTRDGMNTFFANFGKCILLKAKHLDDRSKFFEEYEALVEKT